VKAKVRAIRYFEPVYECPSDRLGDPTRGATNEEITKLWLLMIDAAEKGDYECRQFLNTFGTWASELLRFHSH
jgi:hypothetical protein